MKVVILAGGLGTRMSEYTKTIPKPMVKIGKKPILEHIMDHYYSYGFKDFCIAGGYKIEAIEKFIKKKTFKYNVQLIFTGKNTLTGGRLKRLKKYIDTENFFLTYGDGLSDVNINKLLSFHLKHKKTATVTAVHPVARFGELKIKKNLVVKFKEKPQVTKGWINGGFFVFNKKIFNYIKDDKTILEKEPLESLSKKNRLVAFKHNGFWQCVDTKRERDTLHEIWKNK